jgi:hypothetical protein
MYVCGSLFYTKKDESERREEKMKRKMKRKRKRKRREERREERREKREEKNVSVYVYSDCGQAELIRATQRAKR